MQTIFRPAGKSSIHCRQLVGMCVENGDRYKEYRHWEV